jgi:hypothetical protein
MFGYIKQVSKDFKHLNEGQLGKILKERLKDKRRDEYYKMIEETKLEPGECTFQPKIC